MTLQIEVDGELDPEEVRRIARLIEEGYIEGEATDAAGERGWWSYT